MAASLDSMAQHNLDLLESGNFADAEIFCNGTTWKVHKLILRSRCRWFEKAFDKNWQEAQSGKIHLEEERPDLINHVLKFIYSGQYTPDLAPDVACFSTANLESKASLWRTADYFLLPDLKAVLQDYLLNRLAATLFFIHKCRFSRSPHDPWHKNMNVYDEDYEHDLEIFLDDLFGAVEEIYKCPAARELQKMFAVFACGLREHLPKHIMWKHMDRIPEFQQDVSTALIALHFPETTDKCVAQRLEDFYPCPTGSPRLRRNLNEDCVHFRCSGCGKEISQSGPVISGIQVWVITLDPFSPGMRKWCSDCACSSIKSLLQTIISEWPAVARSSE